MTSAVVLGIDATPWGSPWAPPSRLTSSRFSGELKTLDYRSVDEGGGLEHTLKEQAHGQVSR